MMFVTDVPAVSHEAQVSGRDARSAETRAEGDRREYAGVQPDVQSETQTQHTAGINIKQGQQGRGHIEIFWGIPTPRD